jgi:hypothetical protein
MPCLVSGECSEYNCGGIKQPIDGAVLAPFVDIGFSDKNGGSQITVGNKSSPPDNHAVIKSFEYGCSEGQAMKVEIFDEDGGDFAIFMERLSKTLANSGTDYRMVVNFGWIIQKCDGSITVETVKSNGGVLTFLPLKMDVAYEQGKLKFTIEGKDMMDRIAENRVEDNLGSEDQKMPLRQAIEKVFAENDPKVTSIEWKKREGAGRWDFSKRDGGTEGPKAVWTCDQQNALATVRKWIAPCRTEDGCGIVIEWNCAAEDGEATLIFWEGPDPDPKAKYACCANNLGTYIVNGGKCSSVISFSPSVSWTLFGNSGNVAAGPGPNSGGSKKSEEPGEDDGDDSGLAEALAHSGNTVQWRSNATMAEQGILADKAHTLAVKLREAPAAIEADLKIQGDPTLVNPILLHGKTVSLIVINPFHIKGGVNGASCGDWLAQPPCNKIFSNKNWRIAGVNHQITEGNYVTTLKLKLEVPGVDLPTNAGLGGCKPAPKYPNARVGERR